MKVKLLAVALVLGLLAGCTINTGGPSEPYVTNAGYATDHTLDGEFVICDDRETLLGIMMEFVGEVSVVRVWLEGESSGRVVNAETFTPNRQAFRVTYFIPPGVAPLSVSTERADFTTQAVVVTPTPEIIGHTTIYVSLEGGSAREISTDPIPVIANCG